MLRFIVRSSAAAPSPRSLSWAGFITAIAESNFRYTQAEIDVPTREGLHAWTKTMPVSIDVAARDHALSRFGLPESLLLPTAAVNKAAIEAYVGEIERVLVGGLPHKALLVRSPEPPAADARLPIWDVPGSIILRRRRQVWVHIGFSGYRRAYATAFPDESIVAKVLSHALNSRMAAVMGFEYARITPVSRGCNSSSGFSERSLRSHVKHLALHRRRTSSNVGIIV